MRNIANELNIDSISFLGRVDDVRELLSITDIGVIPSVGSEAVCRIALEMLSFGIPVVGSNVNSIPEIISDYGGIVVNPGRPEEIAGALEGLAINEGYKRISENIKSKIREKSPERFINSYMDIYSKVLDR